MACGMVIYHELEEGRKEGEQGVIYVNLKLRVQRAKVFLLYRQAYYLAMVYRQALPITYSCNLVSNEKAFLSS